MTERTPDESAPAPNQSAEGKAPAREAELISFPVRRAGPGSAAQTPSTSHLLENRSLIIRRSLLATAVGGVVPLPVMDDYLAGRVRAGMLMRIADRRRVDLAPSSAELLADPREGTAARNATMTAATLLALKLAWRKFFLVLGAGRRAEEMATTFQMGTLFDHFCAKLHLGAGTDRPLAIRIRAAALKSISESERAAVVDVFRDGGRVLGRTISEAPAWATQQLQRLVEQYVASGGNPDAIPRPPERTMHTDLGAGPGSAVEGDGRWLDRAAAVVERRLSGIGNHYLESLLSRFERNLAEAQAATATTATTPDASGREAGPPGGPASGGGPSRESPASDSPASDSPANGGPEGAPGSIPGK